MADAAMLLVEVLRDLRASIDAMAEEQIAARVMAPREEVVQAFIDGLADVRRSIDKQAHQQAEFQRDVVSLLEDITRTMPSANATGTLESIERGILLIADRYRPFESDLSPNLDD